MCKKNSCSLQLMLMPFATQTVLRMLETTSWIVEEMYQLLITVLLLHVVVITMVVITAAVVTMEAQKPMQSLQQYFWLQHLLPCSRPGLESNYTCKTLNCDGTIA